MRLVRFLYDGKPVYGQLDGHQIQILDGLPFGKKTHTGQTLPLSEANLLAPVEPSKVVAVGLNYITHAEELGMDIPDEPILFMKPSTSVIGPSQPIVYPSMSAEVDYEAELAIVIKDTIKHVSQEVAPRHILGFTCGNDVTARDLQRVDGQWTRCKSFDSFCPLGPWVETDLSPLALKVEALVNGEIRQSGSTASMIFDCNYLVSFVSKVMTLLPGDVIMTGTPPGVGHVQVGDKVEIRIQGIGSLVNEVKAGA